MFKKIIFLAAILTASSAFADRCLENASNSELLDEISRRMDGSGSGQGLSNLSVYCNSYNLVVSLVDLNGQEKTIPTSLSTAQECSRQLELIGNISRYQSGSILKFCNSYNMARIQVRNDNIQTLSPISFSTQVECEAQLRSVNRP
jgi:hypothetical protein